ncbi:hypothetical protein OAF54_00800 [bacterium]|nr:hypothetical protein [bacterium]
MCEPVTLAMMTIGSTLVSAGGQIAEGKAKKRAGEAQARLNEQQAERELEIAALYAERDEEEGELLKGAQIAQMAASGGTANALLVKQTEGRTELNKQLALVGGQDRATTLRASGAQARAAGSSAYTGAILGAAGTTIKGAQKTDWKAFG